MLNDEKRYTLFVEALRRRGLTQGKENPLLPNANIATPSDAEMRVLNATAELGASPAYQNSVLFRFRGALDIGKLRSGLEMLAARHEAWHTTFVVHKGQFVRRIAEGSSPVFIERTLSAKNLLHQALADQKCSFEFGATPLLRAFGYRLGVADHALLVVAYHAVCDGWTVRLAISELSAWLSNVRTCISARPEAVPYSEFAARQRHWLENDEARRQKMYWERHLKGMRSAVWSDRDLGGAERSATVFRRGLPRGLTDQMAATAVRNNCTIFSVHVCALSRALAETTGESDVTIGTPMHNRLSERDKLIFGCCVNVQPLRINLERAPSLRESLEETSAVCRGAVANQSLCVFAHVLGYGFRMGVVFELLSESILQGPPISDFSVDVVAVPRTDARYGVHVVVDTNANTMTILYCNALFDAAEIEALAIAFDQELCSVSSL